MDYLGDGVVMKKILGAIAIASSFVGMIGYMTYRDGILVSMAVVGATALVAGLIYVGVELWVSE